MKDVVLRFLLGVCAVIFTLFFILFLVGTTSFFFFRNFAAMPLILFAAPAVAVGMLGLVFSRTFRDSMLDLCAVPWR